MLFSLLIGITVGLLIYLYLRWENDKKKVYRVKLKPINIYVPIIIGVLTWFLVEMLTNCKNTKPTMRFMNEKGFLRIPDSDMFIDGLKY